MKTKAKLLVLLLLIVMVFCTACGPTGDPEPTSYTVTFTSEGDITIPSQTIEEGKTATRPEAPTREGYRFMGWYLDAEGEHMWSFAMPVTGDTTIYILWEEIAELPTIPEIADVRLPDTFVRADSSTSIDEIIAMYDLTDEYVDNAINTIKAMVELSKNGTLDETFDKYNEFEESFYHIAEQMTIASVIYYYDMAAEGAKERHLDTTEKFYDLQNEYMIACRNIYLESPYGVDMFANWSAEEIEEMLSYDPKTVELRKEIEDLQTQYDELDDKSVSYNESVVEIYKQIILKNNELARLQGYDNYYAYATKDIYGRDYSAEDVAAFRDLVKSNISPRITNLINAYLTKTGKLTGSAESLYNSITQMPFDSGETNYLVGYLNSLGDTTMGKAMRNVFNDRNCIFSSSKDSHPTAFQTHFYEQEKPFCLFGSEGQSASTIVHEIGHYYADLVNTDIDNYDLCETHSQGNEFIFLSYLKDQVPGYMYEAMRVENIMYTCITILMASVVDEFEYAVYSLSDEEISTMTLADFDQLMTDVFEGNQDRGFKGYGKSTVTTIRRYFTSPEEYWKMVAVSNPVYYVSYAISGVAAIELYAEIETDRDAAIGMYTTLVEGVTERDGFVGALHKAGLTSPFESATYTKIGTLIRNATK